MTIIMTALTSGGIVMAGESRCLKSSKEEIEKGLQSNNLRHELHTDNEEKVFLLGGKFGLAYSGACFNDRGWNIQNNINELDYLTRKGTDINTLAKIFNEQIEEEIEDGIHYGFYLCGYEQGKPRQICYVDGKVVGEEKNVPMGFRTDLKEFPNGCYEHGLSMQGKAELIQDFIKNKNIPWNILSLKDAIECVDLLMMIGTKCLRYFDGYQQLSGGNIDILVISPMYTGFVKHKTLGLLEVI